MGSDDANACVGAHVYGREQDQEAMAEYALATATAITANSPVAVVGTKANLIYARDHSVEEGLLYEATWNMAMLQTTDMGTAAAAFMSNTPPTFPRL